MARLIAPWSVKGIDDETRELARRKAKNAGINIGAWINKAILDHGSQEHFGATDLPNVVEDSDPEKSDFTQSPPMKIHDETMVLEVIDQIEKRYLDLTTPIQSILSQLSLRMDLVESKIKKDTLTDDM